MEVTMKEQLYTIPVNDAFNEPCECPLCKIYDNLEQESIDFMLGPTYEWRQTKPDFAQNT